MKKITILIIMLGAFLSVRAADKFYYSGDKKITLKEQAGKEVVIVPASTPDNLLSATLSNSPEVLSDNVKVYRATPNEVYSLKTNENFAVPIILEKSYKDSQGIELIPTGSIDVRLKKSSDYAVLVRRAKEFGLNIVNQDNFMPLWYELVTTFENTKSVIEIANRLYETGDFQACIPGFAFDPLEFSYDPDVYNKWELYNPDYNGVDINVVPAWDYATGKGIKIAIVDTGIDLNHKDLAPNIQNSYNCILRQSPAPSSSSIDGKHGTHVAGIAAAVRNNGIQVAGVAPDAKLMIAIWSLEARYRRNACSHISAGINWAWQNGSDIISCSWKCLEHDMVKEAINNAISLGRNGKGCVVVKSAGNFKENESEDITFPGNYRKEVIAVGSIGKQGRRAHNSSHGENLLVVAPGVSILSTTPNNEVDTLSGTSMACPHVSGIAALILERNPDLTAEQVREIIAKSTKKVGDLPYSIRKELGQWNEYYGYGLIDAYHAVMNTPRKK